MKLVTLNKFYKIHSKFYDLTRPFFLLNRKKAVSKLDLHDGEKVLDIACGTGLNTSLIMNKKVDLVGIDYSQAMLDIGKKKYPSVMFVQGDVSKYQFEGKFDKIICTYSFSIIDDWKETILNAKNALENNGKFVILDFYKFQGLFRVVYPLMKWWLSLHGVNPEKDIEGYLRNHFEDVQVKVLNSGYNCIIEAARPKHLETGSF